MIISWLSDNYLEIFGAVAGIVYVFLEIRQSVWLWPLGIATSAAYIAVFFSGKLYADMSLQAYYVVISILGWYWWVKGTGKTVEEENRKQVGKSEGKNGGNGEEINEGKREAGKEKLRVTNISMKLALILVLVFTGLILSMYFVLSAFTDSPVPGWDSFITSLSIVATWMLARKIYEHWYLWIVVNLASMILFITRGLYPTVILYGVYCSMSFVGLAEWRKSMSGKNI